MILFKYVLLILSLIQFIMIDSFWTDSFYWFFIWMLFFHINWFYVEKINYKKVLIIVLGVLGLVNLVVLPEIPLLMLILFGIEVRHLFSVKHTLWILGAIYLGCFMIFQWLTTWPNFTTLVYLAGVNFLAITCVELFQENRQHKQEIFAYNQKVDQQENDLRDLKTQMIAMEEVHTLNERNRISRDLHDTVGHTLSAIVIQLAALVKLTEDSHQQANAMLIQLHQFAKEGLANVRQVIHQMKPSQYQRIAFIDRLNQIFQEFENNTKIKIFFNSNPSLWKLSPEQETLILRACQEFLANSLKHGQASEIRIQYHFTESSLILTMADNGIGTDEIVSNMGLTGMTERTKLLSGKIHIQSAVGNGFRIRIVLPKGGRSHEEFNN